MVDWEPGEVLNVGCTPIRDWHRRFIALPKQIDSDLGFAIQLGKVDAPLLSRKEILHASAINVSYNISGAYIHLAQNKGQLRTLLLHLLWWAWETLLIKESCLYSSLNCLGRHQSHLHKLNLVLLKEAKSYTRILTQNVLRSSILRSNIRNFKFRLPGYSTIYAVYGRYFTTNLESVRLQ